MTRRPVLVSLCLALVVVTLPALAQPPVGPGSAAAAAEHAAIEAVAFLVGEWRGEGWIRMGPGEPRTFVANERVRAALDGHALIVEGLHFAPGAPEESLPVHHALALLSWDGGEDAYRFQTHVVGRGSGNHRGRVAEDGAFVWEAKGDTAPPMRFTIRLDEQGRWSEKGEIQIEGVWQPFFGMTLERVEG